MNEKKETNCGVCEVPYFERNNYYYGKNLTVRDFSQEQDYVNEKRWLINRMIHGWGVVCGLDVYRRGSHLVITPGLAMDCCGHEVLVCEEQIVPLDELEEQCHYDANDRKLYEERLVVCLEYWECKSEPVRPTVNACDEKETTEYNRIRDSFKIRLKRWDEACISEPHAKHCPPAHSKDEYSRCSTPSVHEHLCEDSKKGCPECETCECIVLAVVTFTNAPEPPEYEREPKQDYTDEEPEHGKEYARPYDSKEPKPDDGYKESEQDPYQQRPEPYPKPQKQRVDIDCCTYRRIVYGNPLLYDLIDCYHGDVPHIVDFSWRKEVGSDRRVDWDTFVGIIEGGLDVVFDQPLVASTLNPHTFFITVSIVESGTGYFVRKLIPVRKIVYAEHPPCYHAKLYVDEDWQSDELTGKNSELAPGVDVEIILRGSSILGTNGRALDGDYTGDRLPTGNGVAGGDFVDWFAVEPRPKDAKKYRAPRGQGAT